MLEKRPNWWHEGGVKLQPAHCTLIPHDSTPTFQLKFSSDWYSDRVNLTVQTVVGVGDDWGVTWRVRHDRYYPGAPHAEGLTHFNDLGFAEAFGLTDNFPPFQGLDAELVARYSVTVARAGKFIRAGNFLNIPGPGTGLDGDSNLSIYLSDDVKDAAKGIFTKFLEVCEARRQKEPKLWQPVRKSLAAVAELLQVRETLVIP